MTCNEISGVRCTTEASRVELVDQRVIIALDEEFGVGGANLLSISITQTYIIYIYIYFESIEIEERLISRRINNNSRSSNGIKTDRKFK